MVQGAIPEVVRALVVAYRGLLETKFGERLGSVRLFGSYARGDADESSDVDVAVVIDHLTETERTAAVELGLDAHRRQADPERTPFVSPLVWSTAELEDRVSAERRIARDILTEGIAL